MSSRPPRRGAEGWQAANRTVWDQWTEAHLSSRFYAVDRFLAGEDTLCPVEISEVGPVDGLSLLHLQCHFGLDTLSWARRGAAVTGVDFSPLAIRRARELAKRAGLEAEFRVADVLELDRVDHAPPAASFDLVFSSYGVVDWLRDLAAWARVVRHFLRPGGRFHLVEFHPILGALGDDGSFEQPYFGGEKPLQVKERGSYAAPDANIDATLFVWPHSLGEIVSALLGAGLQLEALREHAESPYACFPCLREIAPGRAVIPEADGRLPLLFSLVARRPES